MFDEKRLLVYHFDNHNDNLQSWFRNNMSIYERFTKLETEPKDHVDLKNINTGEELATVYTYDLASVNKILESVASCTEWRNLKSIQRAKILNQ